MYYISHCMRVPKAYSRHEQFQNGCVHSCRLYPCSFSLVFLFTDRIPRNHVGASRIAHVCFASPFLFLSLSLPPPLFVAVVLFLREIYTSGGRGWKEDSSLSLEDSTLHRCWITGAPNAAIKLHSGGNVGTQAEQIRRQRMNVAGVSISRLFRPRPV